MTGRERIIAINESWDGDETLVQAICTVHNATSGIISIDGSVWIHGSQQGHWLTDEEIADLPRRLTSAGYITGGLVGVGPYLSDYEAIPGPIKAGLWRYCAGRIRTGGFLRAVLENNLHQAVARADSVNLPLIPIITSWVYSEAPLGGVGDTESYTAWTEENNITMRRSAERWAAEHPQWLHWKP